ncbi:hypothetical protein LMG28614_06993 [Paraburkholderia ultramafica]|uniref:Uncharacterized protein n=1 Tax=Paraburkholderia ultramafica TaxID=1544867 RepID=A0A6S7BQD0_9BURK|nr:hypothetical protein LMG28614_06993 [Paraburkholderia ultramafica]
MIPRVYITQEPMTGIYAYLAATPCSGTGMKHDLCLTTRPPSGQYRMAKLTICFAMLIRPGGMRHCLMRSLDGCLHMIAVSTNGMTG